jgi:pimeloyl-ACP methyl ester carboxylesterase
MPLQNCVLYLFITSMKFNRKYIITAVCLLCWLGFRNCKTLELRMSDEEIVQAMRSTGYSPQVYYKKIHGRTIRYIKAGNDSLPKLICLHGSPSSLSAWRALFADSNFLKHYQVIAIDRPGYGYSGFGNIELNLQRQVQLLQPIIDSITYNNTAILLGASYGGPVATQLAANLPGRFCQLVLLSSSLQPGKEKTYWFSHVMAFPLVKYLFPATFRMSSQEKLSHAAQLKTLSGWEKVFCKVMITHGDEDNLVYYDNAVYAKNKLLNAAEIKLVTMNGKGHAVIFSDPGFIRQILLQNLEK